MRGFTLIELMVVVMIIAISAALAMPGILNVIRDRKVQRSAAEVFSLLQEARGRSFGRGSAVRVFWDGTTNGGILTLRESYRNIDLAAGSDVPAPFCWGADTTERPISHWQRTDRDGQVISTATLGAFNYPAADPAVVPQLDLCFTPRGLLFQRQPAGTGVWGPAAQVFSWRFQRAQNNVLELPFVAGRGDFSRFVHVAPNGVARLSL